MEEGAAIGQVTESPNNKLPVWTRVCGILTCFGY